MSERRKRPSKADSVALLTNTASIVMFGTIKSEQFAIMLNKMKDSGQGDHFLYEREVEGVNEAQAKKNPDWDSAMFVQILTDAGRILAGASPKTPGVGVVRIDSIERATEITKNEADAQVVQKGMAKMREIANTLKPLIQDKATISIALKNVKPKETPEDSQEAAE